MLTEANISAEIATAFKRSRDQKTSKLEKPLIDQYWAQVRGTIVYEFCMVQRTTTNGPRLLDTLILPNQETKIAKASEVQIEGQNIILVQVKYSRLGLYLMGRPCSRLN